MIISTNQDKLYTVTLEKVINTVKGVEVETIQVRVNFTVGGSKRFEITRGCKVNDFNKKVLDKWLKVCGERMEVMKPMWLKTLSAHDKMELMEL